MNTQSVHGEPNSCTDKSGAQRRGHDRACECATPFGRGKVYMNDDEYVEWHQQRMRGERMCELVGCQEKWVFKRTQPPESNMATRAVVKSGEGVPLHTHRAYTR